jgi:hypothetical protein
MLKKKFIKERLEKLGIDKGPGSNNTILYIHAPHARAVLVCHLLSPWVFWLIASVYILSCRPYSVDIQA